MFAAGFLLEASKTSPSRQKSAAASCCSLPSRSAPQQPSPARVPGRAPRCRAAAALPSRGAPRLHPAPRALCRPGSAGHSRRGRSGRAGLTQAFKLLPGRAGVGIAVVQGVGDEQHPLHLPGRREGRERWARGRWGPGALPQPCTALTARGSSGCAAGSGPGTPLRAGWSWRSAAGAAGSPCRAEPSRAEPCSQPSPVRPFLPRRRPRGGAEPPPLHRPGPAMLDFAIFAVTFLLILVGAVLYLYPVMLPAMGRGALGPLGPAQPGPQCGRAESERPRGRGSPGPVTWPLGSGGAPGPYPGVRAGRGTGLREQLPGRAFPGQRTSGTAPALRAPGVNPAFQRRGLLVLHFCRPPGQMCV